MARATRTRGQSKASVAGARGRARLSPTSTASAVKDTPAILQAIARRDPDAARIRMGTHLLTVQEFLHDHPQAARMEPLAVVDQPVLDHRPPREVG